MFSRMQLNADIKSVASRFDVVDDKSVFAASDEISGFDHLKHPIITNANPTILDGRHRWGLVPPDWKKMPEHIWNRTISAKLEYLPKRYSWQKVINNRCLIPVTAYFEFHWNDPKGKSKTKYIITHPETQIFALGGIYSAWTDPNGKQLKTFAICTTAANEDMEFVHNKDAAKDYHRMPVMLNPEDEKDWLDISIPALDFSYPNYKPNLTANPIEKGNAQMTLF